MSTKSNLATQLDLNKTNIVLGKGYAIEKLVEEIKTEQQHLRLKEEVGDILWV